MKYLLLISILLLSGCTQYRYDVSYEKCNGQTGSYMTFSEPYYSNRDRFIYEGDGIRNVCDFSYTRTAIQ